MKILIILGLVAYCAAQTPTPCETPKQWEAKLWRVDPSKEYMERAKISYDAQNQRVRVIEEDQFNGTKDYFDTLYLHNVMKEYKLNLRTKKCNVSNLDRPFRPFEVPPFAKFDFEAEVGPASMPGEHMTIQAWEAEFRTHDKVYVTVTMPDCVPIRDVFESQQTGYVISDFYATTLGITDPMVFIPPSECKTP